MQRALFIVTIVVLALGAAAVTYVQSLQAAPAAGYQPPPLYTALIDQPDPPAPVKKLSEHLYMVGPLKVVHVWGTPRQMGLQYGKAVGADFRAAYEIYMHQRVEVDQGYSLDYQRLCAEAMAKHIPPEYIEEMKAVAEGGGVPYDEILRLHTHADMVHFGHDWGKVTNGRDRPTESLCSNFVAFGGATKDGKVYHGRNLDWTIRTGIQTYAVLYIAEPKGGVPFAILTYTGGIGGVTGMNAEGITFGEMTSSTADETLDGLPLFLTCRRILDSCRDLAQVEQFVKAFPDTTGWNFVVADGEAGDARAFEVDAVHRAVFRPNDPAENDPPVSTPIADGIRRTNHPTDHEVQKAALARAGIKDYALARVALQNMDTWQRYTCLGQWIGTDYHGKIDERIARAMLQTPPVAAGNTLHSAVFNATDRVMWVANASDDKPAHSQTYIRIDLREWIGKR
jgi:Acyl-coenzyme A:6-aminopenicillanic acid acyl-transferase